MNLSAYIINLKHRTDRLAHISNEIKKLPLLNYTIIEGIIDNTNTCFQSHKKCIQTAKENNLDYILILEDDAIFIDDCINILINSFIQLNHLNWDMFYLGANLNDIAYTISPNLIKLTGAFAAHAYIVHNNFYDKILQTTHDKEMDVHYSNFMKQYNIYMCNPMIAFQKPSYSDLQNGYRDYNSWMLENYNKYIIK